MTLARDNARLARTGTPVVNTAQDLRDLVPQPQMAVQTLGANVAGDGGGGIWYWDAADTTSTDNLGTVLVPTVGGAGRWKRQDAEVSNVVWFGADDTGVADSAAAMNAAAAWAFTESKKLVGAGKFLINSTVDIFTDVDLSNTEISAADPDPAIRVGAHSSIASNRLYHCKINIGQLKSTSTGLATAARGSGLELRNVYSCTINVKFVSGFGTGIRLYAQGSAGASYNTLIKPVAMDNLVNLLFDADAAGWTNENIVLGGQFKHNSSWVGKNAGTIGIHLPTNTRNDNNNNRFYGVTLEGNATENTIYCEGNGCVFEYCRYEQAKQITLDGARFCRFIGGYNPPFASNGINIVELNNPTNNSFDSLGGGPLVQYTRMREAGSALNTDAPYVLNALSSSNILELRRFDTFKSLADITSDNWACQFTDRSFKLKFGARTETCVAIPDFITTKPKITFGTGLAPPDVSIGRYSADFLEIAGGLLPDTDGTRVLGAVTRKWKVIHAATGTINTSDERVKQDIAPLDDAEKRVAVKLKGMMKKFRLKQSVKEKGDDARIHIGVIAQEVKQAFEDEGLDAHRYGLFCYDKWEQEVDEDGTVTQEAGEQYSMRYEELLAFIISAI